MSAPTESSNANILARHTRMTFHEAREMLRQEQVTRDEMEKIRLIHGYNLTVDEVNKVIDTNVLRFKPLPPATGHMREKELYTLLQPLVRAGIFLGIKKNIQTAAGVSKPIVIGKYAVVNKKCVDVSDKGEKLTNNLVYINLSGESICTGFINSSVYCTDPNIIRYFDYCNTMVASGGTMLGQFNRLVEGMLFNREINIPNLKFAIDKVVQWMPYKFNGVVLDDVNLDFSNTKMNWESDAGAPFNEPCSKYQGLEEIFIQAQTFVTDIKNYVKTHDIIRNSDILEYDDRRINDTIIKIKNKTEVMAETDLQKKVRNYFVLPGALTLLFSIYQDFYMQGVTANDIHSTAMMCGFSWAHGGADRLAKALTDDTKWYDNLFVKVYSDDLTFSFKMGDKYYVVAADIKYLDLSMKYQFESFVINYFENVLVDKNRKPVYTRFFKYLGRYNVLKAFNSNILLPRDLITYKRGGLNSGVNGTTSIGSVVTMIPVVELRARISEVKKPEDFSKLLVQIYHKYGFNIKPGTEKVHEFSYTQKHETKFTVLGQKLAKYDDGRWIPKADPENIFTSFVRPTKRVPETERHKEVWKYKYALLRAFGAALSGGFMYEELYNLFRDFWNQNYLEYPNDKYEIELKVGMETMGDEIIKLNIAQKPFPEREWFASVYLDETIKDYSNIGPKPAYSVEESRAITFEENPTHLKFSWADATEDEEEDEVKYETEANRQKKIVIPPTPMETFAPSLADISSTKLPQSAIDRNKNREQKREDRSKSRIGKQKEYADARQKEFEERQKQKLRQKHKDTNKQSRDNNRHKRQGNPIDKQESNSSDESEDSIVFHADEKPEHEMTNREKRIRKLQEEIELLKFAEED